MEDLYAAGDHVLLDGTLHRTVTRVDSDDGEPRIYVRFRLAGRVYRADLGQPDVEEGPFTPYRVVPYRPSKRAKWRRLYRLTPA
jgi:hypothetical protein